MNRAIASNADLAGWLLEKETIFEADSAGPMVAAERVCQKLSTSVSRLVAPAGVQGILSRALHLTRAEFPFLKGVGAGTGIAPAACLEGLVEHVHDIDSGEAITGSLALLTILLDLLDLLIGEDLTLRLLREVWPELPFEPTRLEHSNGREAAS